MNKNSNKKSNKRCENKDKFLIHDAVTITTSRVVDVDDKSDTASVEECDDNGGIKECECGKSFKSSSGLRKHKRHLCCTKDNIIMKLIKDNAEMKELMR